MTFDVRKTDLAKLNSLTKYPSIPTYHALDPKNGGLLDERVTFIGTLIGTEKIDGTNARIVFLPDGTYLLGSREELLYAKGDLIGNPALGIVEALKPIAERLNENDPAAVVAFYVELFGGKITSASKQYTGTQSVGWRLFDAVWIPDYADLLPRPLSAIAAWRDNGGQTFADENALHNAAQRTGLQTTPRLFAIPASELPTTHQETLDWLRAHLPQSRSVLDPDAGGKPEGIVVRTTDRAAIAKIRYDDYERTLKRRR